MTAFILMGVAGSGKSTVGRLVADRLALPFIEGDDFHPPANIEKMSSGIPLTDEDREPWIDSLASAVNQCATTDAVVACSALTTRVRDRMQIKILRPLRFLHLQANVEVLLQRLRGRTHFMRAEMLSSQIAALENTPAAVQFDAALPVERVATEVADFILACKV